MGEMLESGRLPDRMKFAGDGLNRNELLRSGIEKSSLWLSAQSRYWWCYDAYISLLRIMPVSGVIIVEPKIVLTVLVMDIANPSLSTADI